MKTLIEIFYPNSNNNNMERLTPEEKEAIKQFNSFMKDVANHTGHIADKKALFRALRSTVLESPMVNGFNQVNQLSKELSKYF